MSRNLHCRVDRRTFAIANQIRDGRIGQNRHGLPAAAVLAAPDKAVRNFAEADKFARNFAERLVTVLFVAFEIRCFCYLIVRC